MHLILSELAERQLGFSPQILEPREKDAYFQGLREHMLNYPHDVHFSIQTVDDIPSALLCLEEGCDGTVIGLGRNSPGIVSFDAYGEHIQNHPTHVAMRNERAIVAHGGTSATPISQPPLRPRPRPVHRSTSKMDFSEPLSSPIPPSRKRSHQISRVKEEYDDNNATFSDVLASPSKKQKFMKFEEQEIDLKPLSLSNRDTSDIRARTTAHGLSDDAMSAKLTPIKQESPSVTRPRPRPVVKREATATASGSSASLQNVRASTLNGVDSKAGITPRTPVRATNAAASGSNIKLQSSSARPSLTPEDQAALLRALVKNEPLPDRDLPAPSPARMHYSPGELVKKNILNATVEDPEPSAEKHKDLDFFAQPDADARYDDEGNYYGRGRDMFAGPQADENDIKEFVLNANADVFDGDETVGKALKELGLNSVDAVPAGMKVSLMPHQIIGVNWMLQKEKSRLRGGCLADEMGLGKTVQTIATMVMNPPTEESENTQTLIIAPLALLDQWREEIEEKTDTGIKCLLYHGSRKNKILEAEDFDKYDVVLTTYNTMALEWPDPEEDIRREKKEKKEQKKRRKKAIGDDNFIVEDDGPGSYHKGKKKVNNRKKIAARGPLFEAKWYRIVCDEAHMIKNCKTRASRAITDLKAEYRWALTGTPIINSLDDAYPILRFIKLRPWYDRKYWWDELGRLERKQPAQATRKLQAIYRSFQLRRTKTSTLNGQLLITLPPREIKIIKLTFTNEEREIYNMIESQSQAVFNVFLREGTVLKNYNEVFVLLLRLRQICNHPALIQNDLSSAMSLGGADLERSKTDKDEVARAKALLGFNFVARLQAQRVELARNRIEIERQDADAEIEDTECPICFDVMEDAVITECMHIFCRQCTVNLFNMARQNADGTFSASKERECPNCRTEITQGKIFSLAAFEPTDAEARAPEATIKSVIPGARPSGSDIRRYTAVDSDIEILEPSDDDGPPRRLSSRNKGKGKARMVYDSEDDSEHESMDDDMSDFIVEEEDEEEADARRALRRKAKGKKPIGAANRKRAMVVLDSDDEFAPEEQEVVFGGKKKESDLTPEQIKMLPKFMPSTKMKHMMETIVLWIEKHPNEKILVTSQWTSCLDLMSNFLLEKDIVHTQYRGNMSRKARETAVRVFQTHEKARIMLMSTRCGGVGLNLTRGNRMICMDLAWSEAVENQTWSRIHRIGQKRSVAVERFIIEGTIEERILNMQERKKLIADSSLGEGTGGKLGRLSVRDLANLFGINI